MSIGEKLREQARRASDGAREFMAQPTISNPPIEALPSGSPVGRWEYATDLVQTAVVTSKRDDHSAMLDVMNARGAAGWELIQASLNVSLHDAREGHVLLFKRPLQGHAATGPSNAQGAERTGT